MSRKSPRSPRPSPGRGGHESPRRLQDPQQQSRSTWDQSPTTNDYSYRVAVDRLRSMLNKQESSVSSGPLPWDLASSPRPGSPSRADQFQYGRSPSTHQPPAAFSKSKVKCGISSVLYCNSCIHIMPSLVEDLLRKNVTYFLFTYIVFHGQFFKITILVSKYH